MLEAEAEVEVEAKVQVRAEKVAELGHLPWVACP